MSVSGPLKSSDFSAKEKQVYGALVLAIASGKLKATDVLGKLGGNEAAYARYRSYQPLAVAELKERQALARKREGLVSKLEGLVSERKELVSERKGLEAQVKAAKDDIQLLEQQRTFLTRDIAKHEANIAAARQQATQSTYTSVDKIKVKN